MITIPCPCGHALQPAPGMIGRTITCPACNRPHDVPVEGVAPAARFVEEDHLEAVMRHSLVLTIASGVVLGIGALLPLAPGVYLWDIGGSLFEAKGRSVSPAEYVVVFFPLIGVIAALIGGFVNQPFARGVLLMGVGALPLVIYGQTVGRATSEIYGWRVGGSTAIVLAAAGAVAARGTIASAAARVTIVALGLGGAGAFIASYFLTHLKIGEVDYGVMAGVGLTGALAAIGAAAGSRTMRALSGVGVLLTLAGVFGYMVMMVYGERPDMAPVAANGAIRILGPYLIFYAGSVSLFGRVYYDRTGP